MNIERLKEAGLDYEEVMNRLQGKTELFERLMIVFTNDPTYASLLEAIAQENCEQAFEHAHTLKGMAGNLGMTKLYENLLPLVEELRSGKMDNVNTLLTPIAEDYHAIINAMKE